MSQNNCVLVHRKERQSYGILPLENLLCQEFSEPMVVRRINRREERCINRPEALE
jgi:hypothetical protein